LDFKDYSGAAAAWNFAGRCLQQKGYAPTTVAVFEFKFLVGGRPNPSITERDLEIRIFLPAERSPCDGYSFEHILIALLQRSASFVHICC
jgi:hypothetical protein